MKVETVFQSVLPAGFSPPFWRSNRKTRVQTVPSQMMNGSSFSLTECGPWHGPWAHKGKSALSAAQIIRRISADLLPYPQSDISCDSHLKQLMKTIPYVKLHFIRFSFGWKLTLKMFCLSEHFPLGAEGLMMYNPSWRLYGRASQSKHFFPLFYITLTNRNAEPFNYRACLTHPESQIFWRRLAEGEKCTEFPELLVKKTTPRKLVNKLAGPAAELRCLSGSGPWLSSTRPAARHPTMVILCFSSRLSNQETMGIGQKEQRSSHRPIRHELVCAL